MASYKSLLLRVAVRPAGKKSYCSHNTKHVIAKGEPRMVVKAPGIATPEKGYCAYCGLAMVTQAQQQLSEISRQLGD
jgi:hypothetical protein